MANKKLNLNVREFRFSFLFAMTTIILLAGAGIFLYRFLEQELMQQDHQALISKVDLFRHQLSTLDKPGMIVTSPNLFRELIAGHPNLRLTLLDEHGQILLATSEWVLPQELLNNPVDIANKPDHDPIVMPTLDQPYHAVAAWGATNSRQDGKVLIVLALDVDQAQTLLLRYRKTLLITLLFSVFTAATLGFIIAQRGLRPLHTMAETASVISANHLQKRLSVAHTPAELKELAGAFNGMLGRLHLSFVQLSDFSSDIAHELRTPINNLMGQTQVALSRTREASEYKAVLESNLEEYAKKRWSGEWRRSYRRKRNLDSIVRSFVI